MKSRYIKALYKEPGKAPIIINVENELEALQRVIGGYLETASARNDVCVICDEEGRLKGLPFNVAVWGVSFVGPILIVGVDGEEFCDLPGEYGNLSSRGYKV